MSLMKSTFVELADDTAWASSCGSDMSNKRKENAERTNMVLNGVLDSVVVSATTAC